MSSLEPWLGRIEEAWKKGAGPRAIYDELRLDDEGFVEARATLSAVKRVCARLKRARGVQPEDVAILVETRPGEVPQVDFGYVGRLCTSTRRSCSTRLKRGPFAASLPRRRPGPPRAQAAGPQRPGRLSPWGPPS